MQLLVIYFVAVYVLCSSLGTGPICSCFRSTMPGPHHLAMARPILKRWTERGEDYFYHDILLALCENYHDEDRRPLWRLWNVQGGGCYPYWFLAPKQFDSLNNGAYLPIPDQFYANNMQLIYIFQNYQGFAQIYVNTPQLDPPGIYAVFESNKFGRDQALFCTHEDTFYVCHRKWPQEDSAIMMRQNVIAVGPRQARL